MDDLTGRTFGAYHVGALIGRGGMASVYEASRAGDSDRLAVKVLPREVSEDRQYAIRFARERKLLGSLRHPNIVEIIDSGQSEGYTYIVMPLVTGGTLENLMRTGKPAEPARVVRIISEVGESLEYVHAHGIVHRDLKPGNVLLDSAGTCLLSDFGIARIREATTSLTTGFIGTPGYASPEQIRGDPVDGRSDLYSLAVILYELLTGTKPFVADSDIAVLLKHLHDPVPPLRNRNANVPVPVERIVLKALAKRAADRQPTVRSLVDALQEAYAGQALVESVAETSRLAPSHDSPTVPDEAPTLQDWRELEASERMRFLAYLDQDSTCVSIWKLHKRHMEASGATVTHDDFLIKGTSVFAELALAWNAGYPHITLDELLLRIQESLHVDAWTNLTAIAEQLCRPGDFYFLIYAGQWGYAVNYKGLARFLHSVAGREWRQNYQMLWGTVISDLREPSPGLETRWLSFVSSMMEVERLFVDAVELLKNEKHDDAITVATTGLELLDVLHEERPGLYGLLCEYAVKFHYCRGVALHRRGDRTSAAVDFNKVLNFDPECYDSDEYREKVGRLLGWRTQT